MKKLVIAIVVASLLRPESQAEEAPRLPDPATILVPDLSRSGTPEVVREGSKYFFFHKEGVGFEKAHADLSDCFRFLQPSSWESVHMNRFVPWVSSPGRRTVPVGNPYGLVGAILAGAVEGSLNHRDYQAKMRSCMEPRGYIRYGVAQDVWKRVTDLPPDQSIAILAKIASGPGFGKPVPNQ
jgi:hypothetical protein